MVGGNAALSFGAPGVEAFDVGDDGVELVVSVQTTAELRLVRHEGHAQGPKWVTLRDPPSGDRAARLRWRKRARGDARCDTRTWSVHSRLAPPPRVLTTRAGEWACDWVATLEGDAVVDRPGPGRRCGRPPSASVRPGSTTTSASTRWDRLRCRSIPDLVAGVEE